MNEIYEPAQDSYLLQKVVKDFIKKKKPRKILDMGSGSGILARTAINCGADEKNITLVDINSNSVKHLKKKLPNSKVINSNLFSKLTEKFDLIIFNPPYLPEDKDEPKNSKLATTGGKNGSELINKFLLNAKNYLNSDGKILLLTSSLTKNINWRNFKKKLIASEKLFFEELYVWKLK